MNDLTDLDICRRVAKIEGEYNKYDDHSTNHLGVLTFGDGANWYNYNPLTDDALCFKLMVKYKITVEFTRYYEYLKSTTVKAFYDNDSDNGYGLYMQDINPNKAICLAIIEAHKELLS